MTFEIDNGKIKIDRLSLDALFQSDAVAKAAEVDGHSEDFNLSRSFLDCLASGDAVETAFEIPLLGKISVRILVREGLPKRVAIVRNGMLITTDLQHFNEKFLRFPGCRDFVAVVEPQENDGRALLKRLENPRHNELSAERIPDKAKREAATRAMKELQRQVRDAVKKQAAVSQEDAISLDELGKYFATGKPTQRTKDPKAEESMTGVIVYAPKEIKPKKRKKHKASKEAEAGKNSGEEVADGGGAGGGGDGGGTGGGDGGGQGSGDGGTGGGTDAASKSSGKKKVGIPVELSDVRNVMTDAANPRKRKLLFTPEASGTLRIEPRAAGIADSVRLNVLAATGGTAKNGRVLVDAKKGERSSVVIEFSESYDGPLELSAETAEAVIEEPSA
jgi:hypothetical protein